MGGDPATSCPRCDAVYHADCWDSNLGRCAVYGCEPAPKPLPLPAPEVPRAGFNWAWLVPVFVMAGMSLVRLGSGGPTATRLYPQPPPFPPQVLRHLDRPLEIEALLDSPEAVIPASPDEVPALLEEAQALEDSASALLEVPKGRLTSDVRTLLRNEVVADLAALRRAHRLHRRCEMASSRPGLSVPMARLSATIAAKRRLLVDLWIVKEPD